MATNVAELLERPAPKLGDPLPRTSEPLYHVWSNEHRAWWRPNRAGYTYDVEEAGIYPRAEALRICRDARGGWHPGDLPNEIAVLASDGDAAIGGRAH